MESLFILLILAGLVYVYFEIDPKVDYNAETEYYLLWYNDPFDQKQRKAIQLWRAKVENKSD